MLLSEVLIQIVEYFTPMEALAPSLVCHTWNAVFSARVWWSCDISDEWLSPEQQSPRSEDIIQNAHHIHELVGNVSSLPEYLEIPCTRLKKIQFSNLTFVSFPGWWSRLAQLVAQNDQLEEIDFCGTHDPSTLDFWEALTSRPALTQVRMDYVTMEAEHFEIFWNGSRCLRRLALYDTELPCTPDTVWKPLPGLEELTVGHLSAMALLEACPGLRWFQWQNYDGKEAQLKPLINLLKGQRLRQLESLQATRAYDR